MSDPRGDAAPPPTPNDETTVHSKYSKTTHHPQRLEDELAQEAVAAERADPHRGAVPPGYDWPTHGGYLGCLMGGVFALILAPLGYIIFGFLGAALAAALGGFGVGLAAAITMIAYIATFIILSQLGWRLGKHFLREYPQAAGATWGESDEFGQLTAPADQALAEE